MAAARGDSDAARTSANVACCMKSRSDSLRRDWRSNTINTWRASVASSPCTAGVAAASRRGLYKDDSGQQAVTEVRRRRRRPRGQRCSHRSKEVPREWRPLPHCQLESGRTGHGGVARLAGSCPETCAASGRIQPTHGEQGSSPGVSEAVSPRDVCSRPPDKPAFGGVAAAFFRTARTA